MQEREVRMRSIEALSSMGVREASRIIRDAEMLTKWVMEGEDTAETPPTRSKKAGDKGSETPS